MIKDVGIIGLGTMGSMAAWQLAKQGYSVIGFEQFGLGHDRAGAGGETRLFRTAYKEKSEYIPFLQEARKLWRELEEESGNNLLNLTGGLVIGHPEDEGIQRVLQGAEEYQLEHEVLDQEEAKKRYPQHRLVEDEVMIVDKDAGYLRPELAVVSAAKRAEELGAELLAYTPVLRMEENSGDFVTIHTETNEYQVRQVLITAGPWLREFLPQFHTDLEVKKILLTWFPAKDIALFQPERFPIFTRTSAEDVFYGTPTLENSMVKVAVSKAVPIRESPDRLSRTVGLEEMEDAVKIVSKYLPDLYPEPVRANAYMDTFTPDGQAMIGRVPDAGKIVMMGGFSGHGFKMSPVMGRIAADVLMDKDTGYDIRFLSPRRFEES